MAERLTLREREILHLIGAGKTSKEIAESLKLTASTIGTHRKSICRKLGVHSTAALIGYAMSQDVQILRAFERTPAE